MKQTKKRGFTLIELLVVIAVIGMLASIVLVSLGPVRAKARDARRQADMEAIRTAMELYYQSQTTETYPNIPDGATTILSTDGIGTQITAMPVDPTNSGSYLYKWRDKGTPATVYCVWARLEVPSTVTYLLAMPGALTTTTVDPVDATSGACK